MSLANGKRAAVGDDRISGLPRNVIDCILELLPVEDAARTSILSKQWRYNWVTIPRLVLDSHFCSKLAAKSHSVFKETVDDILLQHHGGVVEFSLVSEIDLFPHTHIDRWIRNVTRNGVKELTLYVSNNICTYKLPSYIFNCPTLTCLVLSKCVFKAPNCFLGFQNLTMLSLEKVKFVPTSEFCVISVPLLVNLSLMDCHDTQYLKILSPLLQKMRLRGVHYLLLNCFMNCQNLKGLLLELEEVVDQLKHDEKSTLGKFLFSLVPTLEILHFGSAVLEVLSEDTVPNGPPFALNCVWHLLLTVDFEELSQTSCALQLMKSVPHLSKLSIMGYVDDNVEDVMNYLDTVNCLDGPLNKLEYVDIDEFSCSKPELRLVKLLLACSPSLVRMCIELHPDVSSRQDILIELMRFPRASPRAELFYFPSSD